MPFFNKGPDHFRLLLPRWDGQYTHASIRSQWIDSLALHGRRIDPYLCEVIKYSIEADGTTQWRGGSRRKVQLRNSCKSLLTGVWMTLVPADPNMSLRELRRLTMRSLYGLARELGLHFRIALLSAPDRKSGVHIHVILEVPWFVHTGSGYTCIFDLLIKHMPDGNLHLAPFVAGGGALEYELNHLDKHKLRVSGEEPFTPSVICPGNSVGCRDRGADACLHPWDDHMYADGSRYDRTYLPQVVLCEIRGGRWIRSLPRNRDKERLMRVRSSRDRAFAHFNIVNAFNVECGTPLIALPPRAEAIIAARRKELGLVRPRAVRWSPKDDIVQIWGSV